MALLLKLPPLAMLLSACMSGVLAEDVADEATFELDCDQNLVVTAPSKSIICLHFRGLFSVALNNSSVGHYCRTSRTARPC